MSLKRYKKGKASLLCGDSVKESLHKWGDSSSSRLKSQTERPSQPLQKTSSFLTSGGSTAKQRVSHCFSSPAFVFHLQNMLLYQAKTCWWMDCWCLLENRVDGSSWAAERRSRVSSSQRMVLRTRSHLSLCPLGSAKPSANAVAQENSPGQHLTRQVFSCNGWWSNPSPGGDRKTLSPHRDMADPAWAAAWSAPVRPQSPPGLAGKKTPVSVRGSTLWAVANRCFHTLACLCPTES